MSSEKIIPVKEKHEALDNTGNLASKNIPPLDKERDELLPEERHLLDSLKKAGAAFSTEGNPPSVVNVDPNKLTDEDAPLAKKLFSYFLREQYTISLKMYIMAPIEVRSWMEAVKIDRLSFNKENTQFNKLTSLITNHSILSNSVLFIGLLSSLHDNDLTIEISKWSDVIYREIGDYFSTENISLINHFKSNVDYLYALSKDTSILEKLLPQLLMLSIRSEIVATVLPWIEKSDDYLATIKKIDGHPTSFLHGAINFNKSFKMLLQVISTPSQPYDKEGNSLLHVCDNIRNLEQAYKLTPDINYRNKEGNTVLHEAAHQGNFNKARFLLMHGADPNIKNKEGKTFWTLKSIEKLDSLALYRSYKQYGKVLKIPPTTMPQFGLTCGLYAVDCAAGHHRTFQPELFNKETLPARKRDLNGCDLILMSSKPTIGDVLMSSNPNLSDLQFQSNAAYVYVHKWYDSDSFFYVNKVHTICEEVKIDQVKLKELICRETLNNFNRKKRVFDFKKIKTLSENELQQITANTGHAHLNPKVQSSLRQLHKNSGIGDIFSVQQLEKVIAETECKSLVCDIHDYSQFMDMIKQAIERNLPIIIPFAATRGEPNPCLKDAHWATIIGWSANAKTDRIYVPRGRYRYFKDTSDNTDKTGVLIAQWGKYYSLNATKLFKAFYDIEPVLPKRYYLKKNGKDWKDEGCNFMLMSSPPTLSNLQIKSNAAYVYVCGSNGDSLFYVNKINGVCEEVKIALEQLKRICNEEQFKELTKGIGPTDVKKIQRLSSNQLEIMTSLTGGHSHWEKSDKPIAATSNVKTHTIPQTDLKDFRRKLIIVLPPKYDISLLNLNADKTTLKQ
jgi:Ankyrin repeats (many copies)